MNTDNPIRVRGIDHVVLRTTNAERLVNFYVGVVGCTVERAEVGSPLTQLRAGVSLIDILDVVGGLR
jgi:catechol 2,3-dioxygenase-like lactoylglutathione lyase family enzyme